MDADVPWWHALETGAVVELTHAPSGLQFRALVEKRSDGDAAAAPRAGTTAHGTPGNGATALPVVTLARLERPYEKLRVALNGATGWAVAAAKFTALQLEPAVVDTPSPPGRAVWVRLKPVAHQKKPNRGGTTGWYVGVAPASHDLVGDAAPDASSVFALAFVASRGAFALDTQHTKFALATAPSRALTESQRHAFCRDGFLQIRGAVALALVDAARRRINHELGVPGRLVDGGVEGAGKLTGHVANCDAVLDLFFQSHAYACAEALIGTGCVAAPRGAQIALRFPELGEPRDPRGTEWHTDGMRQGRRHPFSLLLGVALSDVREPLAGNLTVFPGSHRVLHELLRDDGTLDGCADECYRADSVWGDGTLPDLGVPVQLLALRGDIVLAHPNLAHRGGLNFSPDVRYQVYFRLKHRDHAALEERAKDDLWVDLEGLHHLRPHYAD